MDYRDAEQGAIRVFLADDNLIVREGVRALGAAATGPQVLVTDIRMPPAFQREGIDAAKQVRKRQPGTLDTLIGLGGRHADVHNDHVGVLLTHQREELRQVSGGTDQLEILVRRNEPGHTLPEQHVVLG